MYTIPNKYPTITYNQYGVTVQLIQPTIELIFFDGTSKMISLSMAEQLIRDLQKTVDEYVGPKRINKEPI